MFLHFIFDEKLIYILIVWHTANS